MTRVLFLGSFSLLRDFAVSKVIWRNSAVNSLAKAGVPFAQLIRGRAFVRTAKLVVAAMLAGTSTASYAAPGWTAALTINSFIPTENGLKVIVAGNNNPTGCSSPTWLTLYTSDTNFNLISSAVLTAFAQGKTVKVWAASCDVDGSVRFSAAWMDA